MRPSKLLPGVLVVFSLNCSHLPAQKGNSPRMESPWELRMVTEGVKLRAVLHNRTKMPQTFLYDSKIQPVELILTPESGKAIEPSDTRAEAKFDNTVYRHMYKQVAPQADETLTEAAVTADRSLRWGPFLFTNLAHGVYRAQAVWRSETNEYYDPKSKRNVVLKDIWMGAITSNTIELRVP